MSADIAVVSDAEIKSAPGVVTLELHPRRMFPVMALAVTPQRSISLGHELIAAGEAALKELDVLAAEGARP